MNTENKLVVLDAHQEKMNEPKLDQDLYLFNPEEISLENFKPDPENLDVVVVFSMSETDALDFGAIPSTAEELSTILSKE